MFIAEVVGNVWGTRKHKSLCDKRLLLVRPIDPMTEKHTGDAIMAVEYGTGAGPGSIVLVMDEGGSARSVLKDLASSHSLPISSCVALGLRSVWST